MIAEHHDGDNDRTPEDGQLARPDARKSEPEPWVSLLDEIYGVEEAKKVRAECRARQDEYARACGRALDRLNAEAAHHPFGGRPTREEARRLAAVVREHPDEVLPVLLDAVRPYVLELVGQALAEVSRG